MTQDEIIRMAREAGWDEQGNCLPLFNSLERFAALVAAHEREKAKAVFEELEREVKAELINAINGAVELEREACAKVCEEGWKEGLGAKYQGDVFAAAIRARGEK